MAKSRGTICSRVQPHREHRRPLRVLKVMEIGAGGIAIGTHAAEFTRRLGTYSHLRRILLRYANRRPVQGEGAPFRALTILASDYENNPANDLRLDVHRPALTNNSVHVIVSIGPKGYGFRNESATFRFLAEMCRILVTGGDLLMIGRFMNPWFNPQIGSLAGRRHVRSICRKVGFRVVNLLTPLGTHPIAAVFRMPGDPFIQRSWTGERLGTPTLYHRFVKRTHLSKRKP